MLSVLAVGAYAQITPGNLVIYRVGNGSGALGTTAAPVFFDEFTQGGSLVQSIVAPSTGLSAMTAVGNATTEGIITMSQDGTAMIFTGYRKDAGGTSPSGDTYLATPRVIGTLTASGTLNLTTTLTNDGGSTAANTIRSAASVDGTSAFWTSSSQRIGYASTPFAAGGTTQIDARNSRQVILTGNTLYAANGSTTISGKVQSYGTLPTGATAATPIISLTTADAVNGFLVLDVDAGTAGNDTIYALSTVANQLLKYSFNGSTWVADGSISASGAQNLTGFVSNSIVNLFLTSGTTLFGKVDSSGFAGTLTGTLSSLATAPSNEAFRGIGMFVPVPEPSTVSLFAVAGGLLVLRLRRK